MFRLAVAAALTVLVATGCKTETRSCTKMKELCNTELDTCIELRKQTRENFGEGGLDKLDGCVLQSSTCSEAAGCATGVAAKAATEAIKDFAKGFEAAVKEGQPSK